MQTEEVLVGEAGGGARGGPDDLDGLIDLVARANDVHLQPGAILPVVRASPCAMHNRHLPANRPGLDLLYSTSCHGGKVNTTKTRLSGGSSGSLPQGPDLRQHGLVTSRSDYNPRGLGDASDARDLGVKEGKGGVRPCAPGKDRALSPRGRHQYHQLRPMPAKLPERLPSKDVVMTWLQHGSVPVLSLIHI